MAALICKNLCLPCELCGKAIGKTCEACGKACDKCCKCFSDACKSCSDACQCDCLNEFCAKPFAVTTSVALGLNGVPLLLGLYFGGSSVGSDCSQLGVWLLIQAVLSGGHMAMCIYFFQVMQKPYDLSDPKDRNFNTRIQHLVCYDPGMACYILWATVQFVWLILAPVWVGEYSDSNDDDSSANNNTCNTVSEVVIALMAINWSYLFIGFLFYFCSWCCSCCDDTAQKVNRDLEQAMQPSNFMSSFGSSMQAQFFGGQNRQQGPTVVQGRPVR